MVDLDEEEMDEANKVISGELKMFKSKNKELKGNPCLVSVERTYLTKTNVYIVMEYCPDGDLYTLMEKKG